MVNSNQGWQVFARRWKKPVFSTEKTGLAKIVFASKNRFLPAKIGFCQNIFYYNKILLYCTHFLN